MADELPRQFVVAAGRDGALGQVGSEPSAELSEMQSAKSSSYVEPEWPIPSGVAGRVWIQDDRFEASTRLDGLFELAGDDLRQVESWDGVAVTAYWSGNSAGRVGWSPSLVFSSLTAALAWARMVTSDITVRLARTEPAGTFRESASGALPRGLAADWDARYAT